MYNNFLGPADATSLGLYFENCWFMFSISPLYPFHKWDQVEEEIQQKGEKRKIDRIFKT